MVPALTCTPDGMMAHERTDTISKVAEMMRDIDFCMLTTSSGTGRLRSRPMSNNGEVEFDGDVWFFSGAHTRKIADLEAEPRVQLSYAVPDEFKFIAMTGEASIVRDVEKKQELWIEDLERWFPAGPESPDVVLIKVTPTTVAYWVGEEEGELTIE